MSDLLYSNKTVKPGELTKEIQSIYHNDAPIVEEFHGDWGSLAVSQNLYNGFQPYENDNHIIVVVGGPLLYFRENDFPEEINSNTSTKKIFRLWYDNKIKWNEDLSGPFSIMIINKKTSDVEFVTDLMSFIPVYLNQDLSNIMLSTHIDMLANISGKKEKYDLISCSDFVLHGTVTYPYTLYQDVFQVKPATVYRIIHKSNKLDSTSYWVPREEYKYTSINEAADDLAESLKKYTNNVTNKVTNLAQFISGGEDSRVLSALLYEYPRDAFVFLDYMNREGRVAKKAAKAYGANFNLATRSKTHYIEILPNCADLVGSGSQYHHAHTFSFHKSYNLNNYSAVFGGLFSDALLKGARIKKSRYSNKLPLIGEIKDNSYSAINPIENDLFTDEILKELTTRRREHLEYVKTFRNESAEEWFELWPSSMNINIPNLHVNRRLFKSYEPFMANDVVMISASVPQKWKLNRRLFHKATKDLLKPSKWIAHGDGRLPYFSWYINSFIQFVYKVYKKLGIKFGLIKGNHGPWGEWNKVLKSDEWDKAVLENYSGFEKISSIFYEEDGKKLLKDDNISYFERVNLMQLLYHVSKK